MITIAVFDSDSSNREKIKRTFLNYTMRFQTDIDVLWFFDKFDQNKIKKYASTIHIAFISLDVKEGEDAGNIIYRCNEDCRIVFYSAGAKDLEPLLRFRPRSFYTLAEDDARVYQKVDDILSEIKRSHRYFCYENKRKLLWIPLKSIVYLQSDLKYVNICLQNGKQERIYAKLSEISPLLDGDFIRIHKSYFVNKKAVRSVNKSEKLIVLGNGRQLPVSEANYKAVMSAFDESTRRESKKCQ